MPPKARVGHELKLPQQYQKHSMKLIKHVLLSGMLVAALMAFAPPALAQIQTTGTPGSPSATTTISGKQLPAPPRQFGHVISY